MGVLTEERLLTAVAKIEPDAKDVAAAAEAIQDDTFSWESALDIAERHRVQSLLVHNLRTRDLMERFPPRLSSRIPGLESSASDRWTLFCDVAAPVLDELVSNGVQVCLLKGAALAVTIYPPGTRRLHDLDLLIARSDYPRAKHALLRHGFEMLLRPGQTEAFKLETYHEIGFAKKTSDGYLGIDLHWHLSPQAAPGFLQTADVLARGRRVELGGVPLSASGPEDTFINYANQIAQDRHRIGFQRAGDIYGLVRRGLEWPGLVERARLTAISGRVRLALGIAELLGAQVPADVLEQLERESSGSRRATEFLVEPQWLFRRRTVPMSAVPVLNRLLHSAGSPPPTSLPAHWYWQSVRQPRTLPAQLAYALSGYTRSIVWMFGLKAMQHAAAGRPSRFAMKLREALWETPAS